MPLSRVYIYARWPHKIRETCRHFSPKSCCNLPGTTAWFPSVRSHRSMSPRQPLRQLDIGPNASLPFRSSSSPHARLLTAHDQETVSTTLRKLSFRQIYPSLTLFLYLSSVVCPPQPGFRNLCRTQRNPKHSITQIPIIVNFACLKQCNTNLFANIYHSHSLDCFLLYWPPPSH